MGGYLNSQPIEMKIYPDKIPNNKPGIENKESTKKEWVSITSGVIIPTITIFSPSENNTGIAVLICPGGGYGILASEHEGTDIAKKFAEQGITGVVLKYRLPNEETFDNSLFVPLQDAQQAISLIRKNAKQWNINENKVGVMGFSAGGHLAASLSTHYDTLLIDSKRNVRPDFSILIYPVISGEKEITHAGSMQNLLGSKDSKTWRDYFSSEKQVTKLSPPAFLVHASDDNVVPVANSLCYYEALSSAGILSELHIFPKGGHGFGINNAQTKSNWFDLCINWLSTF